MVVKYLRPAEEDGSGAWVSLVLMTILCEREVISALDNIKN